MKSIAISVIIIGVVLIAVGLVLMFADKIPFLGKLPGDIRIKGANSSFYFPVTTCIIISILLSILLNFFSRFWK